MSLSVEVFARTPELSSVGSTKQGPKLRIEALCTLPLSEPRRVPAGKRSFPLALSCRAGHHHKQRRHVMRTDRRDWCASLGIFVRPHLLSKYPCRTLRSWQQNCGALGTVVSEARGSVAQQALVVLLVGPFNGHFRLLPMTEEPWPCSRRNITRNNFASAFAGHPQKLVEICAHRRLERQLLARLAAHTRHRVLTVWEPLTLFRSILPLTRVLPARSPFLDFASCFTMLRRPPNSEGVRDKVAMGTNRHDNQHRKDQDDHDNDYNHHRHQQRRHRHQQQQQWYDFRFGCEISWVQLSERPCPSGAGHRVVVLHLAPEAALLGAVRGTSSRPAGECTPGFASGCGRPCNREIATNNAGHVDSCRRHRGVAGHPLLAALRGARPRAPGDSLG